MVGAFLRTGAWLELTTQRGLTEFRDADRLELALRSQERSGPCWKLAWQHKREGSDLIPAVDAMRPHRSRKLKKCCWFTLDPSLAMVHMHASDPLAIAMAGMVAAAHFNTIAHPERIYDRLHAHDASGRNHLQGMGRTALSPAHAHDVSIYGRDGDDCLVDCRRPS